MYGITDNNVYTTIHEHKLCETKTQSRPIGRISTMKESLHTVYTYTSLLSGQKTTARVLVLYEHCGTDSAPYEA